VGENVRYYLLYELNVKNLQCMQRVKIIKIIKIKINHHHHHWLDSPRWALAFLRSFAHSSLLRATFFQFLTPNILIKINKLF
jgi:hypothetical protein